MATTPNSIITPQTPIVVVGQTVATANTAKDGTGTVVTVYTAGANGAKVDGIYVAYTGTSVQTCMRIFLNNGLTNATATNNSLLKSATIPANTLSETAGANDLFIPIGATGGLTIPAGYKVNVTIGTTVAAALALTGSGGDL